jgi:hypothetical protein
MEKAYPAAKAVKNSVGFGTTEVVPRYKAQFSRRLEILISL